MTEQHDDPAVTAYRLRMLEQSQRDIAQSLQALVRLEQHHSDTRAGLDRAWKAIDACRERIQTVDDQIPERLDDRLAAIEKDLPTLKLTSGWVVTFTLGGFALAALLVWNLATERHEYNYPALMDRRQSDTKPAP